MKLSDQQSKTLLDHLKKTWAPPGICPTCRSDDWQVGPQVYELREFHGGNMVIGDSALVPIFPVICKVCGNVILINPLIAGIDLKKVTTMDFRKRFERRVDGELVSEILRCIATLPNKRIRPVAGDLQGAFDFWFDGGAAKIQTGYVEYGFTSGAHATVGDPIPALSVTIDFPNGSRVRVQQESWGSEPTG
jgi:hypothetical protein